MYESFYKLISKPFRLSPDPSFFYPSSGHKRALSYLLYGLNQAEGFVVITGAPGTGKTTLAHKLLSQIDPATILVAHLSSTQIEADDLLRLVAASFRLRSENLSKAALLKDLESFLLARSRERKRCLLVVDEAQNLPETSIEELRMLSNFQVGHSALLQVFMLGQEQFRTMLDSPQLEQLQQRVIANFHLNPLSGSETQSYIESRLEQSGWKRDPVITPDAYAAIYEYTGGLPRRINMFCDRLMLFGYLEGLHEITGRDVASVVEELKSDTATRSHKVVYAPVDRLEEKTPVAVTHKLAEARSATAANEPAPRTADAVIARQQVAREEPVSRQSTVDYRPPTLDRAPPAPVTAPSAKPEPAMPKSTPPPHTVASTLDRTISDLSTYLRVDKSPSEIGIDVPVTMPVEAALPVPPRSSKKEIPWMTIAASFVIMIIVGYWLYPYMSNDAPLIEPPVQHPRSVDIPLAVPQPAPEIETTPVPVIAPTPATTPPAAELSPVEPVPATTATPIAPMAPVPAITPEASPEPPPTRPVAAPPVAKRTVEPAPRKAESKRPAPVKTPEPEARTSAPKPTPVAAPVVAPATAPVALPVEAPRVEPAPVPAPPVTTSAPASTESIPAPAAPAPPPTALEPLTQRELALLLMNFSRAYEEGNLDQFMRMFDASVRTEDRTSMVGVRADYHELFLKTAMRQIILGDIRWVTNGLSARGTGAFEVRVRERNEDQPRIFKGTIEFQVERKGADALIVGLYHRTP